jgi:ketosteroid isomerase-like protein
MSIYEKLDAAMENNDAKAYAALLHDDFTFVRHATNTAMTKSEWVNVINNMMDSGKVTRSNSRCIYENDDILVSHSMVSFPDGTSEAVLVCFSLRDGKIVRSETGATPLK